MIDGAKISNIYLPNLLLINLQYLAGPVGIQYCRAIYCTPKGWTLQIKKIKIYNLLLLNFFKSDDKAERLFNSSEIFIDKTNEITY